MKAGVLAIAAAMASGVTAHGNHAARRHAHQNMHLARGAYSAYSLVTGTGSAAEATCGCTTIYTTITGEGSLYFPPPPSTTSTIPTTTATPVYVPTSSPAPVVPTPMATTCPTPGTYTIPATTITLTESTTVCAATSTSVPSGTHTYGGVTTIVKTKTTVTCPYATVTTSSGVVTSTILTTTYVCPSAGTYTIAPHTTSCSVSTVLVYPTPASYAPGTYTQPEVVTTITETNYVVFCPFTSPAPKPTSTYVAPPPPVYTTEVIKPKPTTTKKEAPKSTGYSVSPGTLGTSGNQWAITYTPYDESTGNCKSQEAVYGDIASIALKGFKTVRIYSSDCSGLEFVGNACKVSKLTMIIGVFIKEDGISGAQQQVKDIVAWKQWNLVDLIVIGNEAIHSGFCSASDLAGFISECKTAFKGAGYTGKCTTAEPLNVWQASTAALCSVVDVVGCNIHPFFNADVTASEAGSFVKGQLDIVDGLCYGKSGINLETGWPSEGSQCNGAACPGKSQQAEAIKSITAAVGGKSVMFSYGNDAWKAPGAFGCEQHWGVADLFPDL